MRRALTIRSAYYEFKPYLCTIIGIYGMQLQGAAFLAKAAGLTLVGCGITIFYMRARYRGLMG